MSVALAVRPTTGADAYRQMSVMRARLIARYKLVEVPGRPEELRNAGRVLGVSLGYGCKTIRVRAMLGREWIDELTHDFQIREGWGADLYALLDRHFGFVSPMVVTPKPIRDELPFARPIRDNPQA